MLSNQGKFTIPVKLVRVEGNTAVLATENQSEIKWPAEKVPSGLLNGQTGYLSLDSQDIIQEDKNKLAKAILNEIISNDQEKEGEETKDQGH